MKQTAILISWLSLTSMAFGQAEVVENPFFRVPAETTKPFGADGVTSLRAALISFAAVELEAIDRVCRLTSDQKEELDAAMKEAVEQVIAESSRPNEADQSALPRVIRAAQLIKAYSKPAEEDDDLDELSLDELDVIDTPRSIVESLPNAPRRTAREPVKDDGRVILHNNISPKRAAAMEQPIWLETIDRVLTDEQKELWEQSKSQRKEFERRALAVQIVAKLDLAFLLSQEQRETFSTHLIHNVGTNLWLNGDEVQCHPDFEDEIVDVLTSAQHDKWNELKQNRHDGALRIRLTRNQLETLDSF
jgi:hypothetical protein